MANAFGSFRSRDSQWLGLPDDQSILPLRSDHFIFSIPDSEPNSPAGSGIDSGSGAIATTQQSLVGADLLDAASVAALTGQDAAAAEYQTAGDLDSAGANAPAATIAASMRAKAGFQNESDNGLHLTAHEVGFSWGNVSGLASDGLSVVGGDETPVPQTPTGALFLSTVEIPTTPDVPVTPPMTPALTSGAGGEVMARADGSAGLPLIGATPESEVDDHDGTDQFIPSSGPADAGGGGNGVIGGATVAGTDQMYVRAFDGGEWGHFDAFNFTSFVNRAPTVAVANQSMTLNTYAQAVNWVSWSDADGEVPAYFQFYDATATTGSARMWTPGGGYLADGAYLTVATGDIGSVYIGGAAAAGTDTMYVRAFDGHDWGNWDPFTVTSHA